MLLAASLCTWRNPIRVWPTARRTFTNIPGTVSCSCWTILQTPNPNRSWSSSRRHLGRCPLVTAIYVSKIYLKKGFTEITAGYVVSPGLVKNVIVSTLNCADSILYQRTRHATVVKLDQRQIGTTTTTLNSLEVGFVTNATSELVSLIITLVC